VPALQRLEMRGTENVGSGLDVLSKRRRRIARGRGAAARGEDAVARRQRGVIALEFGLILLVVLPLFLAVGEFYRLSLCDQALARATHLAAMAAGRNSGNCQQAARDGFGEHGLARWLFDRDGDGAVGASEVVLEIAADDGDVANGVVFDQGLCGGGGSWIRVTASVSLRAPFGTGTVRRQHESWATNQG
jgi:uncharacterized protein (UPF0333 family)